MNSHFVCCLPDLIDDKLVSRIEQYHGELRALAQICDDLYVVVLQIGVDRARKRAKHRAACALARGQTHKGKQAPVESACARKLFAEGRQGLARDTTDVRALVECKMVL